MFIKICFHIYLIRDFKKNVNLNFSIIFVGNKKGNEKYINHLEELSNKLGISNYLKILENFDNMPLAYLSSDIILYPSIVPEPFGRVPIEAQAAGKIIIEEAGGIVNDISQFKINKIDIRASNSNIYEKMLKKIENF